MKLLDNFDFFNLAVASLSFPLLIGLAEEKGGKRISDSGKK